jgi:hypothetical protein
VAATYGVASAERLVCPCFSGVTSCLSLFPGKRPACGAAFSL